MGARQKLNRAYVTGSVVVAGLFGWTCRSWAGFILALFGLLALNLAAGEIRPKRRRP